jgi:hypothetical protein
MAVTTTVQDILNGAYGKSLKNQPGTIAAEATELLNVVNRIHRGIYAFSARLNPIFFAEAVPITEAGGTWPRPEEAEAIARIEDSAFAEVIVVPFDDRAAEPGKLSVYEFGQVFTVAGAGNDPSGDLTFWFSRRPTAYTALVDTLDAQWREEYNELLILELAIYLSAKDGRFDEVGLWVPERDRWASLLGAFLQHATSNLVKRFGHTNRMNAETLQSIIPLFFSTPNQPRGATGGGG